MQSSYHHITCQHSNHGLSVCHTQHTILIYSFRVTCLEGMYPIPNVVFGSQPTFFQFLFQMYLNFIYVFVHVYLRLYIYMCVWVPRRPEEGATCPGIGVVSHCKRPDVGTGNCTAALCRNSELSLPPAVSLAPQSGLLALIHSTPSSLGFQPSH